MDPNHFVCWTDSNPGVTALIKLATLHPLQLERKRHIGNDIVNIVFTDDSVHNTFNPQCVKSHFTRILLSIFFTMLHILYFSLFTLGGRSVVTGIFSSIAFSFQFMFLCIVAKNLISGLVFYSITKCFGYFP